MTAPIIEIYRENDLTKITDGDPDNIGTVQAGSSSSEAELHIWNNKDGTSDVSTAENVRITTVTKNFYESGDMVENGSEVVENQMLQVKSITNGEEEYTAVGGPVTHELGDIRGDVLETPENMSGEAGHASGGEIKPGTYYAKVSAVDETGETLPSNESSGVTINPMIQVTSEDSDSETLTNTGNTKLAWKFTATTSFINGCVVKMGSGGSLEANIRIETDNSGNPSGILADSNLQIEGVDLLEGEETYIFFEEEGTVTEESTYWLVIVAESGSGSLRGTTTGVANNTKYFDGTWNLSSNIENITGMILSYNMITWTWDKVTNADTYRVFRTTSSGNYGNESLVGEYLTDNKLEDLIDTPITGKPLTTATVQNGHKHVYKRKLVVPTNATPSSVEFYQELRYMYI